MILEKITNLKRNRVFTIEEAQDLLSLVLRITKKYAREAQVLIHRIDSLHGRGNAFLNEIHELEKQVNSLVNEWQVKLEKLGLNTKGMWIADFDSGDGYFCWKYPENKIEYWHKYTDGFTGRINLADRKPVKIKVKTQIPEKEL
jgi:hypothetical protein